MFTSVRKRHSRTIITNEHDLLNAALKAVWLVEVPRENVDSEPAMSEARCDRRFDGDQLTIGRNDQLRKTSLLHSLRESKPASRTHRCDEEDRE